VLIGGAAARTEVPGVVKVAAVENGGEAPLAGDGLELSVETSSLQWKQRSGLFLT
jgi:hypothetical protein